MQGQLRAATGAFLFLLMLVIPAIVVRHALARPGDPVNYTCEFEVVAATSGCWLQQGMLWCDTVPCPSGCPLDPIDYYGIGNCAHTRLQYVNVCCEDGDVVLP
jgi:hypothetical protein